MRRHIAVLTFLLVAAFTTPAHAYVYWVNGANATPTIARADNDGTNVQLDFIAAPGAGTSTLAVNGEYLFWGHGFGQASPRTIGRAKIDGTSPDPSFLTTTEAVYGLQASSTKLYWSTSANVVRSAGIDGSSPTTMVTDTTPGDNLAQFAVTSSNVFSERYTSTGAASAHVVRTDLTGGSPADYGMTGGTLNGMITNGTALFGIRFISQANAPVPIVTAPLEPATTVGEVVPGDGRAKYGLGLAGCRLFWSTESSTDPVAGDAIGTARTDGSELNRALITGTGVNLQNGISDVAADLLPAVADGCGGISTQPPPVATNPPPPVITPGPTTSPKPIPTLAPNVNIKTISDEELEALADQLDALDLFFTDDKGDAKLIAARRLAVIVENEVIARIMIAKGCSYGPGVIGALRTTAWFSRAPTQLFAGASLAGKPSTAGYAELAAALGRQKAAEKAVTRAAKQASKARGAKRKKAKKALRKAKAALAKQTTKITLTRKPAAKKTLRQLGKRYKRGKAVKLRFVTKLTDPASGNTVQRERTLTLQKGHKRRFKRSA